MLDKQSFLKEISNRYNFRKKSQDKNTLASHASQQLNKYQPTPKNHDHLFNYQFELRQNKQLENNTGKAYRNINKKYKYDSKYKQQSLTERSQKQGLRRMSRDLVQTHKEPKRQSQNLENIRTLEIQRDQLKATITQQSKDILRYQQEITQLKEYIQELKHKDQQNLNNLVQRLNKLDNLALQSQTKILQVQSQARIKQEQLNNIISKLNKQKQDLTAQMDSFKEFYQRQNTILREQIQKKQLENVYIQKLNEQQLNKKNQRIELYEKLIKQKKTDESQIIFIIKMLENEKQEEKKKFVSLSEKFKILEKEILSYQKNKSKQTNVVYQNNINSKQSEKYNINNNKQQLQDILYKKQQIKNLKSQLEQANESNRKLKQQIKQYIQKYIQVEKQLTQKLQDHQVTIKKNFKYEFQNLLSQQRRKYHLLSQEYELTKKDLRKKQIQIFQLKDKLQKNRK